MNITVTPNAIRKIQSINYQSKKNFALRISVQGGGCNGIKYHFKITETIHKNDRILDQDNTKIIFDPLSAELLSGTTVEYKDELGQSSFIIHNPKAVSTCGCGSSFAL